MSREMSSFYFTGNELSYSSWLVLVAMFYLIVLQLISTSTFVSEEHCRNADSSLSEGI